MDSRKNNLRALITTHIAVLFFGMAGVIGRGIALPAVIITFARVAFSSIALFILIKLKKTSLRFNKKGDVWRFFSAGGVMALHWTSFMLSVQTAGVAVGTVTFATFPLFATFLEPIFFKEKLTLKGVLTAMGMLLGVFILAPQGGGAASANIIHGIIWGMVSSLTYAVLSLMNRGFSARYTGSTVCFYEQAFAALLLLVVLSLSKLMGLGLLPSSLNITAKEIALLAVLGIVCTALAHTLFVGALAKVKVRVAGIVSCMEPVYGIILALIFLGEAPAPREIIGCAVVLGITVYTTLCEK